MTLENIFREGTPLDPSLGLEPGFSPPRGGTGHSGFGPLSLQGMRLGQLIGFDDGADEERQPRTIFDLLGATDA